MSDYTEDWHGWEAREEAESRTRGEAMSESREELRRVIEAALLLEGPNPEWASEQAEDVLDALVRRFGEPEWDYPTEKYRPYYRRLAFARWIDYAPEGKP